VGIGTHVVSLLGGRQWTFNRYLDELRVSLLIKPNYRLQLRVQELLTHAFEKS